MKSFVKFRSKQSRRRQARRFSPWQSALERLEDRTLLAAPQLANPILDQSAFVQTQFSFTLPSDTFIDPDPGTTLAFSVTSPAVLPAWLAFAPATARFVGTPTAADAGTSTTITVEVTDGTDTASDTFILSVQPNAEPSFVIASDPAAVRFNTTPLPITVANFVTSISGGTGESGQTLSFEITGSTNAALLPAANIAISSAGTLTYSPTANMSGTTTVTVQLRDNGGTAPGGDNLSASREFTITVSSIRVPGAQSVFEDVPKTIAGLSFADPDPGSANVEVTMGVTNGTLNIRTNVAGGLTAGQIAGNGSASITITAPAVAINTTLASAMGLVYTTALGSSGSDVLEVLLDGNPTGAGTTESATVAITAAEVNDAPSFTLAGTTITADADGDARTIGGFASNISAGGNDTGQTFEFLVSNGNPSLFTVQPKISADGTLTFTPAENVSGPAVVSVVIRDNGGTANGGDDTSDPQNFTITITAPNGAPTVANAIADRTAPVNVGFGFTIPNNTFIDPEGDAITLTATGLPQGITFMGGVPSANPTGTFGGTPTLVGTFNVTIRATATGGFVEDTFVITISANQPPTVANAIADRTAGVNQAFSFTIPTNTFTDPEGDAITLTATGLPQGITFLGGGPSANPTGIFVGAPTAIGTFNVTIRATATGGFVEDTFVITVVAVNVAPSFSLPSDPDPTVVNVLINSPAQTFLNFVNPFSAGPNETQTVDFIVSNNKQGLFTVQPAIAANGTLTFTPAAGAFGTATVTVQIHDNGGIANGGDDTSDPRTFTINIGAFNKGTPVSKAKAEYPTPAGAKLRAFVVDGELIVQINGVPQQFYEPSMIETLIIIGGSKNDEIDLSGLSDDYPADMAVIIRSGSGNDRIVGSSRDDSIDAGSGNDTLSGGFGNDILIGNAGTDLLTESADEDMTLTDTTLTGGLGDDRILTIENAFLTGGDGANEIDASGFKKGAVTLLGGAGNDILKGGEKNDLILGEDGNDELSGGKGNDTVLGGFGEDTLNGDEGADLLIGGFDDDIIDGGAGRDTVAGGNGGAARGGDGVPDAGDMIMNAEVINEAFKKLFAFE